MFSFTRCFGILYKNEHFISFINQEAQPMALAKIVYASMTGNTEEIADIVAEAFEN